MATIPALNDCKPGLKPLRYTVVIAPAALEEKSKGGIIIPSKAEDEIAVQKGRLVAVSPLAFTFADGDAHRATPGDVVLFSRYAGSLMEGEDGKKYRVCKDEDIVAIVEETDA